MPSACPPISILAALHAADPAAGGSLTLVNVGANEGCAIAYMASLWRPDLGRCLQICRWTNVLCCACGVGMCGRTLWPGWRCGGAEAEAASPPKQQRERKAWQLVGRLRGGAHECGWRV